MMHLKKFQLLIFFLFLNVFASAKDPLIIKENSQRVLLGKNVEIYEDKSGALELKDVMNGKNFTRSTNSVLNFGTTSSTYWLRFQCKNASGKKIYLDIQNPIIDYSKIYILKEENLINSYTIDENNNYSKRPFPDKNFVYPIFLENDSSEKTIYLQIKCSEQLLLPIFISTSDQIIENRSNYNLLFGIYLGIIFVMFFYNFFIYTTTKDSSYIFYVIYILFVGLTQAALKGYVFEYLFPNLTWLASRSVLLFSSLTGIFAILFLRNFIRTKFFTPIFDKLLLAIVFSYGISFTLALLNLQSISYFIVDITGLVATIVIVFTSILIIKKGYRPATFFLYSWSLFLISVILFVLKGFGLLPFNIITNNILEIGSAFEVTFLSFALADRINILKREKEASQAEVVNALRENERIIKEQNILLEGKVEERTSALTKSNNELTTALTELKQTQSQLVNAEKMASLGQLTAGIAHEINNPINFVVSNVKPLRRDIDDIYGLVKKYETVFTNESEKNEEILSFKKEIDYDYLKEEITNLLRGIEEGASRTAEIVKGLRAFSRLDETDLKKVNIIEGIESTLILLNTEIMGSIDLVKKYSEIPAIDCYPGKINQVFMNIINNAIYAIKENKELKSKGTLIISTSSDSEFVKISIKDNGIGMNKETIQKVFEPFFTTKDVGKGTGLGMSITFSIINDHNGKIEVNSELGNGTEFIITLPINQKSK